jgi:hypothetical protein
LRLLLLVLMALAFANPFASRTVNSLTGRPNVILAVDHSFSMRYANHLTRRQAITPWMQPANCTPDTRLKSLRSIRRSDDPAH